MDVNLCRLPDENSMMSKFLVPLAGFMWHPLLTDSAEILSKQAKRQFIIKKNELLRTVGVSHPGKSDVHGMPQNFLLKSFLLLLQSPVRSKVTVVIFQTAILTGTQCVPLHRLSAPGAAQYAFPPVNHGFASAAFQGESVLSCI